MLQIKIPKRAFGDILYYMGICLLFMVSYGYYVLSLGISRELMIPIIAIMALAGNREQLIALGLCCAPMYNILHVSFVYGMCIVAYCIKYLNDVKVHKGSLIVMVLLVWELLHAFIGAWSIRVYVEFLMPYAFMIVVMGIDHKKLDYACIVHIFSIATLCVCVIVLSRMVYSADNNILLAFQRMDRLGMQNTEEYRKGAETNPNTLSFLCLYSSIGLMQLVVAQKNSKIDIIMVVLLLGVALMTTSRTFFLCAVITFILFLISIKADNNILFKWIGISVLLFVLIIIAVELLIPGYVQRFVDRFLHEEISHGRNDLFADYMDVIFSSISILGFGTGWSDYQTKIKGLSFNVPHNGIQEVLLVWGIPGVVIFVALICLIIKYANLTNKKMGLLNFIPLILFVIKIQAGQFVTMNMNIALLSMAFLSLFIPLRIRGGGEDEFAAMYASDVIIKGRKITGKRDFYDAEKTYKNDIG